MQIALSSKSLPLISLFLMTTLTHFPNQKRGLGILNVSLPRGLFKELPMSPPEMMNLLRYLGFQISKKTIPKTVQLFQKYSLSPIVLIMKSNSHMCKCLSLDHFKIHILSC